MSKSLPWQGNAARALRAAGFVCLAGVLLTFSLAATISVTTPALAQASAWTPPIAADSGILLPPAKKGAPPKLKTSKCPTCQKILDDLQEALQDWWVLEWETGSRDHNKWQNPPSDAAQSAIDKGLADASEQMTDATANLGGEKARNAARDAHRQKVNKGNAKTGNKPDPDAGDKDKLAQRIKDLVTKYENCERHPPPECQPPPPSNTTPSTPQPPKQPDNPPPPPPPPVIKPNVKLPEVPDCFPTPKAKADKIQELNDLIAKLKGDYDKLGKPIRADDPTRLGPPDPDDPAAKQAQANIDAANELLKKAQKAKDDGCPPPKKSENKNDTGTGDNAQNPNISLPWRPPLYPPIVPKQPAYSGKSPYSYKSPYAYDTPTPYVEQPLLPPREVSRYRLDSDEAKPGDGCNVGPSNIRLSLAPYINAVLRLDDLESRRGLFLLHWYVLPDKLKAAGIFLYLDTLAVFASEEARLRAAIAEDEWKLEDHSTFDILRREFGNPPVAVPNPDLSQPFKTQANTDAPSTPSEKTTSAGGNSTASSAQPKAPSDISASPGSPVPSPPTSQAPPSDSGTPGGPSEQTYVPMRPKVYGDTPSGQPGPEEPGVVVALITDTSNLPRKNQPRPQTGSGDDPVIGITGGFDAKLKWSDASSLGLKPDKDGVINLSLLRMQSAWTFNLWTDQTCCKIDYKSDGGTQRIINSPSSFHIPSFGNMPAYTVLRNSFQAPYAVPLQNLPGTNDACLMVFPAPWGAFYAPPPAHADLPGTAIRLAPPPQPGGSR